MALSKLNLSIRWKMLAGFLISAIIPCVLMISGVSTVLVVTISLLSALLLALFSIYRVMRTLKKVQKTLHLNSQILVAEKDELCSLEETLVNFSHYEEGRKLAQTKDGAKSSEQDEKQVKKQYSGHLATGEPQYAEMCLLSNKSTAELEQSIRLVGDAAKDLFVEAVNKVIQSLEELKELDFLNDDHRAILDFQVILLMDPALIKDVEAVINKRECLLTAVTRTFDTYSAQLQESSNSYMKGRVNDLKDLRHRIIESAHELMGNQVEDRFLSCKGKIVVCRHLLPTEVISLYDAGAVGAVVLENTASSHTQILLSSLNLASVTSIKRLPVRLLIGRRALLDPMHGKVVIDPAEALVKEVFDDFKNRKADIIEGVATLRGGEPIHIGVTVNNSRIETSHAVEVSPDFVGLFRTEMHFLGRKVLPLEDELRYDYEYLTSEFSDKLVVLRLLDLGGDKVAGFQKTEDAGENPCMGLRSMRFLLENPKLFTLQLRAALKATHKQVCLLYPMVSGWDELQKIGSFVDQTIEDLRAEGVSIITPLKGIMVEVPSIVARFEDYVEHFDIFNIGTNDLTQYTLAADRNNDMVSEYYRSCHPSILSMIKKVATLCKQHGKKAIICGQMGADFKTLPLLIGLGIEHISVNWSLVSPLKKQVSELDMSECRELADKVLSCRSLSEVEACLEATP